MRLQARSEAEVVAARASSLMTPPRTRELQSLASEAARAVRGRVLILDRSGRVLADSAAGTAVGASYRDRPEIARAIAGEPVQERRDSLTLGEELLATAVPILGGDEGTLGVVRVTQSVAAVNRSVRRSWLGLGVIGALVLLFGLVAGAVIAARIARPISGLEEAARRVAAGDLEARARVEGSAEQRSLATAFNAMTSRLATLLAAQREFVADASHQLRTPLAGLRLRIEEARVDAADDRQREDLDAALGEVDRLAAIVTDLLELSRASAADRPAASVDLGLAAHAAAARFAGAAAAAGSDVRVSAPAPGASLVACHPRDLDRILDVLVENALAYAPGTPVELTVDGHDLAVRDHGPGLAEGEEQAVFERFHRGAAARAGAPGTGLGLAIARDLARRWGGDVTMTTAAGGGTLATVRLLPEAARFAGTLPTGAYRPS